VVICIGMMCTSIAAAAFSQTVDRGWSLTFTLSGGIAGLNRTLDLESGGAATAIDRQRNLQVRRQISRDDLSEIERFAASAVSFEKVGDDVCRDCLTYAIDLRVAGRAVRIRANDITLSDSKAAALVQALTRVQQRLLAEP
jgi:hypothetical protein